MRMEGNFIFLWNEGAQKIFSRFECKIIDVWKLAHVVSRSNKTEQEKVKEREQSKS